MTPPDLLPFSAYGGDWNAYEKELYRIFMEEIASGLHFRDQRVGCLRNPETAGRWNSFWHLVQEGGSTERQPDMRRCERIRWVRWVIKNGITHPEIEEWQNSRGTTVNTLLWYREEYLVVLAARRNYRLLKTAYCTHRCGRIRKLRKERDVFLSTAEERGQNG